MGKLLIRSSCRAESAGNINATTGLADDPCPTSDEHCQQAACGKPDCGSRLSWNMERRGKRGRAPCSLTGKQRGGRDTAKNPLASV